MPRIEWKTVEPNGLFVLDVKLTTNKRAGVTNNLVLSRPFVMFLQRGSCDKSAYNLSSWSTVLVVWQDVFSNYQNYNNFYNSKNRQKNLS